ncbi:MAG TPA: ABC transporter ATP-binding protein [Bacteroidia bacterium]|nr:ABC transporter ATP-binding protein [Bacteroidia bacterium]
MVNQVRIAIENAELGYRGASSETGVLSEVNLELREGEFVAAVGLNGAGKSTLLKTLCGILAPLKGRVLIHNKNILEFSALEIAKTIAIVLSGKIEGFNLSCFDLVAAGQMPYTNSFHQLKDEHLRKIEEALMQTELGPHRHKSLHELSDGLFQKALIAKALAQQSPVMLLDEPSAYLDYASKHRLFALLKELAEKQGKCILVSTHDLDLVQRYCRKVIVLANGTCEMLRIEETANNPGFRQIGGKFL